MCWDRLIYCAGGRQAPAQELEIELVEGGLEALRELAGLLRQALGLGESELRSKLERGLTLLGLLEPSVLGARASRPPVPVPRPPR